jgi:hypothetical protein
MKRRIKVAAAMAAVVAMWGCSAAPAETPADTVPSADNVADAVATEPVKLTVALAEKTISAAEETYAYSIPKALGLFDSVWVDGRKLTDDQYEAESGSTRITLLAAYLDTLAIDQHTIEVRFTDGVKVRDPFWVSQADQPTPTPAPEPTPAPAPTVTPKPAPTPPDNNLPGTGGPAAALALLAFAALLTGVTLIAHWRRRDEFWDTTH